MKNLLILLIRAYQNLLSPFKTGRCPFVPSCSEYSVEALNKYGSVKGLILGTWRILRCNPFNKGYLDPPENWAFKFGFKHHKNINKTAGLNG